MIWDLILQDLKKQLGERDFKRYIQNIKYNESKSDSKHKVLEVDNIFLLNWIKANYISRIALLFEAQTDIKPEIKLIIKDSSANEKPKYNTITIPAYKTSVLNPSYTFDSFVVGESNKFAFSLSKEVAQNQAQSYNPLFISGEPGLGKTHLLNAIGNYNVGKKVVILISSEEFLNDYMIHLNNKNMDRFREKYRKCDYLLIDDIQFFSEKFKIQEEFFHTFDILRNNNKQIVLTSDRKIKDLKGIEERLKSRFESAASPHINAIETSTKIAIIKKKCEFDLINLDNECIEYIALNINNIRTIEGILTNINSFATIMNKEINLNLVQNVINNYKRTNKEKASLNDIIEATSLIMNIKQSEIKSKKQTKDARFARKIVIYLGQNLTTNSTAELAKNLDMKDNSSIIKAIKRTNEEIKINNELRQKIEEVEYKLKDLKK